METLIDWSQEEINLFSRKFDEYVSNPNNQKLTLQKMFIDLASFFPFKRLPDIFIIFQFVYWCALNNFEKNKANWDQFKQAVENNSLTNFKVYTNSAEFSACYKIKETLVYSLTHPPTQDDSQRNVAEEQSIQQEQVQQPQQITIQRFYVNSFYSYPSFGYNQYGNIFSFLTIPEILNGEIKRLNDHLSTVTEMDDENRKLIDFKSILEKGPQGLDANGFYVFHITSI